MIALKMIKFGSSFLRKHNIQTHILDSEILLSKTLNKPREKILTNLDEKISKKIFLNSENI